MTKIYLHIVARVATDIVLDLQQLSCNSVRESAEDGNAEVSADADSLPPSPTIEMPSSSQVRCVWD